jgi:hypothetical protein
MIADRLDGKPQPRPAVHPRRLEEQKAKTGKVRALILKGRQQGCSTYVGGGSITGHAPPGRSGVHPHARGCGDAKPVRDGQSVSRALPELVKPSTGAANAKELNFDALDSGYKVGTAGTKGVGRSSTLQLFHGSEVGSGRMRTRTPRASCRPCLTSPAPNHPGEHGQRRRQLLPSEVARR